MNIDSSTLREVVGDLWNLGRAYGAICVPTNGLVKNNGDAVMGRGVALQAVARYPGCERILGDQLKAHGNHVTVISSDPSKPILFAFPTKHDWRDPSDPDLIRRSCRELAELIVTRYRPGFTCLLPRPGVGLGGLDWESIVRPILVAQFDGNPDIAIVSQPTN